MTKIIIIGNSDYAFTMNNYIKATEYGEVVAFAVEDEYVSENDFCGKTLIGLSEMQKQFSPQNVKLIMGIGYRQMGDIRKKLYNKCKKMGYSFANYIHPTAVVSPDIRMGEGNNILESVIIESNVEIGNCNIMFAGSVIGHDSKVGDYNTFSIKAITSGRVDIGNNCMLGVNSTLKDNIEIHDYALIGAATYAQNNIMEYEVLASPRSYILEGKRSTDYL